MSAERSGPFEPNVGERDRRLRALVGIGALAVAVAAFRRRRRSVAAVTGATAVGLLFNAVTRFCGLNARLGVDTTSD